MTEPNEPRRGMRLLQQRLEYAVFLKNPILVQGLCLTPAAAAAVNLKAAIALGAVLAALLIPLEVLSSFLLKRLPAWLRASLSMLYGVGMAALLTPLITSTYKGVGITLGIYLPLLAVNSLLFSRMESYAIRHNVKKSLLDGIVFSIGAAVILILIGFIRELLGSGSLYGISLGIPKLVPAMSYPFAGLLLLGFFSALFQSSSRDRANPPSVGETEAKDP